nr:hypothetical protein [uncultured Flavobacterium sp.]
MSAYAISNKSNITLDEAVKCIRDYIDKTCIDVDGGEGRRAQMLTVISKIANSLPDDQKADAGEIVNGYRNYDIFSGPIPTNTFEEH